MDTENMTKSEMQINNRDAILYIKDKICSIIINYEDCVILISGSLLKDEIIKVARSISENKRSV